MPRRLWITDFDGVLCDSVLECLLVTYNAYHRLHDPAGARELELDAIDPATQRQFRQLRAYLKGAEDFIPIWLSLVQQIPISSQAEFDCFRATQAEHLTEYVTAFYAERDYLIRHEKTRWLRLNPLFEDFSDALRRRSSFAGLHILTTKRRADVLEVFQYEDIPFPAEQITYVKAAHKSEQLQELCRRHDADEASSAYFEDQVDFLIASQQRGLPSYLAGWGYVSAEQQAVAQQAAIPIITPQQYKDILQTF